MEKNNIKLNIIILAGGNSLRFKENKLLYKFDEFYMYEIVLNKLIKAFKNQNFNFFITVVTQYEDIYHNIIYNKYPSFVKCVLNENCKFGISNSIKYGIKLFEKSEWFMFVVADQPYVKYETYFNLFFNTIISGKNIGSLIFRGIEGNPVIFNKKYKKKLLLLNGDKGGRVILKKNISDVYFYEINDILELKDIDTKYDI